MVVKCECVCCGGDGGDGGDGLKGITGDVSHTLHRWLLKGKSVGYVKQATQSVADSKRLKLPSCMQDV